MTASKESIHLQSTRRLRASGLLCLMPPRRRRKPAPVSEPPAAPAQRREQPRFFMLRGKDGAERAERSRTRAEGERDQAMADFFGVGAALSPSANIRSMDSLLGEVLESLHLEEDSTAPEILAEAWLKAVGPALASLSELVSLAQQTATIRVHHAAARYELTRLKPQMLKVLNATLGDGSVSRVRLIQ